MRRLDDLLVVAWASCLPFWPEPVPHLAAFHAACLIQITKLLTDNGKAFSDRPFGTREKGASGEYEFDQLCQALRIEYRLPLPRNPQKNGMVERSMTGSPRFWPPIASTAPRSGKPRCPVTSGFTTIIFPHKPWDTSPTQAMKKWYAERTDLFVAKPRNFLGPDTQNPV